MPNKDREFAPIDIFSVGRVLKRRRVSTALGTVLSPDPVAGAVRVIIQLAEEADLQKRINAPAPGRPIGRGGLLAVLETVERRRLRAVRLDKGGLIFPGSDGDISRVRFEIRQLGVATDPSSGSSRRVGTAQKGEIVQTAAKLLNISPERARDLVRQLADLASTLPEKMIHRQ